MSSLIYLDNAATTAPFPEVTAVYNKYVDTLWFNPSALYAPALDVKRAVDRARQAVLLTYGSQEHLCTFTSGGTEAANMVIRFGARKRKGMNYVCAGFEHPCVEESFKQLREDGAEVRWVETNADGSTSVSRLMDAIDDNTALVSVMHVNNETGAVNDIDGLAQAVKTRVPKAVFHSDGVQAFGRVMLRRPDVVDYYTVSAHKIHGLKGTGAVLSRRDAPLRPMLRGGGQERGLRSGTENVPGILMFGYAADNFYRNREKVQTHLEQLRKSFLAQLDNEPGILTVAPDGAPHIVSLFVDGLRGETLMHSLESEGIVVSTGSACSSKKEKSRAARALGVSNAEAASMVRISFCPMTEQADVIRAAETLKACAEKLRSVTRKQS